MSDRPAAPRPPRWAQHPDAWVTTCCDCGGPLRSAVPPARSGPPRVSCGCLRRADERRQAEAPPELYGVAIIVDGAEIVARAEGNRGTVAIRGPVERPLMHLLTGGDPCATCKDGYRCPEDERPAGCPVAEAWAEAVRLYAAETGGGTPATAAAKESAPDTMRPAWTGQGKLL